MKSEQNQQINLGICATCGGTGQNAARKRCAACNGVPVGMTDDKSQLFWVRPLTVEAIALRRAKHFFAIFRLIVVCFFTLVFFAWYGFLLYRATAGGMDIARVNSVWFWFGALCGAYALSLAMRFRHSVNRVRDVRTQKIPDIELAMTDELRTVIDDAYRLAASRGDREVVAAHFLVSLLKLTAIQNMFIRLSVLPDAMQALVNELLPQPAGVRVPAVSKDAYTLLFAAFLEAEKEHQLQVRSIDLAFVAVRALPALQEKMYDLGVDMERFGKVIAWVRSRAELADQLKIFRSIARTRPTSGIDRAMTAVATPLLNQYSQDITISAQFGHTGAIVGRDKEIAQVLELFEGGAEGVLIVGDPGVGKMAIIEGVAQKMVQEEVPETLKDKRLVLLEMSSLLSGVSAADAAERMLQILMEVQRAGNIMMCIPDVHTLVAAREGGEGAQSVASVLKEVVERSRIPVIATTAPDMHRKVIKGSVLEGLFRPMTLAPMDSDQTILVLETKVGIAEYEQQVFFSYDALDATSDFARKHLQDQQLPESAIDLMKEVAVAVKNKKGKNTLVTREDVAEVVAAKTNIPVTAIAEQEGEKLLRLEEMMHTRVIGQAEAVTAVANALRRARAKLTSGKRPIANFLFVGPTGVGKTELAKTIASVYFGGEDKMIRLDMSEYQTPESIYRLIGETNKQGSGLLTEAVRAQPFSLLLLDELEKADKQVLNIFLQVMDDGRITDSVGRVVDFTNLILIATSNAGSAYIQDQVRAGASYEVMQEGLLSTELRNHFSPEFLNRFDGVIVFHPMTQEDVLKVAGLMIKSLAHGVEEKYGAELHITDAAMMELAHIGFDPEFGARPMRRAIQEHVENALARILLEQKVERGNKIVYDVGGEVRVEK